MALDTESGDLEVYRAALVDAREDLRAALARRDDLLKQIEERRKEMLKFARVILALSNQLGIEPPADVVAIFNDDRPRKPYRQRVKAHAE